MAPRHRLLGEIARDLHVSEHADAHRDQSWVQVSEHHVEVPVRRHLHIIYDEASRPKVYVRCIWEAQPGTLTG